MAIPFAEIDPNNLASLIKNHGYVLTHYRAIRCPCIDPTTGSPNPNHTVCEHGWQYFGEETIQGIITSISSERQYMDTGGFWLGTMNLTVLSNVRLAFHDKIVHQQSAMVYTELLDVSYANGTSLRYPPIEIDYVADINGISYTEGVAYTISGNKISWIGTAAPVDGSQVSIAYLCHPVWLIISNPHVIRDTQTKFRSPNQVNLPLPVQAQCKLEWLVEG